MKILITGASGFIGSFVVEEALRRGMETWAAVRATSSRRYLSDERIHFLELDLSSSEKAEEALRGHDFDYIVHAAGATKCLRKSDFFAVNTQGTVNLVEALLRLQMPLKRFVYISSLSVFGAVRERQPHTDICESDLPKPDTAYGKSKLQAEQFLDSIGSTFHYIVLRPTGVYGPRERDYFMLAKTISRHADFAVGFKRQDITFVYVEDLVQCIFLSLDHGKDGRKYFVSDGRVYSSTDFSNLVHDALGSPWWIRLRVPLFVLRIVTAVGELASRLTGKTTALNNDKYNILSQRNWRCDVEPTMDELGYHPHFDLRRGVTETIRWYKRNHWL